MNPVEASDLTPAALVSLRNEPDAMRVITDRLKVREMGPADHIRTKHEVKTFVKTGDLTAAEALLKRAQARRELNHSQNIAMRRTQQHGQRMGE
jgi:hypothetical protein